MHLLVLKIENDPGKWFIKFDQARTKQEIKLCKLIECFERMKLGYQLLYVRLWRLS